MERAALGSDARPKRIDVLAGLFPTLQASGFEYDGAGAQPVTNRAAELREPHVVSMEPRDT